MNGYIVLFSGITASVVILLFNDTEEKAVEKAMATLADVIPLEAIQPPHSPH